MKMLQKVLGLSAVVAVLFFAALSIGYGDNQGNQGNQDQNNQGQDERFHQKTDSGDDAQVLPSPDVLLGTAKPTFAGAGIGKATVYPASYGSGKLINHGGPEMPNAAYTAVFWNSAVANSTQTTAPYASISAQIQAFALSFGSGVPDYTIIQQYSAANPIAATLSPVNVLVDSKSTQSSISDSSIRIWLKGLFSAGRLTPNANTLYGLYFPAGMRVSLNIFQRSCTSFCGYHSSFSYNNQVIKYAVYPFPNCSGCSIAGYSMGDMLTIVSSHEIREAVTDPQGNAWYDSQGYEGDDKCVWHNLYRMSSGFTVQPEFSNAANGCVVP